MTVGELIRRLGGEVVHGSDERAVLAVDRPDGADKTDLIFCEDSTSAAQAIEESWAAAIVVPIGFEPAADCKMTVISAEQPRLWFAKAGKLLQVAQSAAEVDSSAILSPNVRLGKDISIGAGAVIGEWTYIGHRTRVGAGVVIGEQVGIGQDCVIHPKAVLYRGTRIGDRVVVHAGAVLGADGFGYVRDKETGTYTQFPQVGKLIIEDDVEIGANTTIDRGALSATRIRRGTKIDNLVHIGHNCDIGEDVVIAAQTGISGSSTVGRGAVIAGQVGIGDHAHVGAGVILGGQAGVLSGKTLKGPGQVLWGTPAKPLKEYLRELAVLARLARKKTVNSEQ